MLRKKLAIGVIAVLALTAMASAGPSLAQGPSPEQLSAAGWTCFVPPVSGIGARCFNPAQGRPPVPPLGEDGRASYMGVAWNPAGEFEGHVDLIRADLYAGQPCPQAASGEFIFRPNIGYYECLR